VDETNYHKNNNKKIQLNEYRIKSWKDTLVFDQKHHTLSLDEVECRDQMNRFYLQKNARENE